MASPRVEDTLARAEQLVHREPSMAIDLVGRLEDRDLTPSERARAHWVVGNACRIQGRLDAARASLEAAIAIGEAGDDVFRHDVAVSLAAVLISQGEVASAEELLSATLRTVDDRRTMGRARMQLAMLRHRSGRFDVARLMYQDAVELAAGVGDELGEMRARNNWGLLELNVGDLDAAEAQFERALSLARAIGQVVPEGVMRHNLGYVASRRGDPRTALERYDEARATFIESGSRGYLGPLMIDTARNLSSLGLVDEARRAADEAVELLDASPSDLAEALLYAARARRDAGDAEGSLAAGRRAKLMFARQGRLGWVPLADFAILLAELDGADFDDETAVVATIDALEAHGWGDEAGFARVTAALALARSGRLDRAAELLAPVADAPLDGPAAERAVAVTASAFLAAARDDAATAKRLVTAGLRELGRLEQTLGALELRAYAHSHGAELAQLGVDLALDHGGPRELLARLDAQRTLRSARSAPPTGSDPDLDALLTELRTVVAARRDEAIGTAEVARLHRRERAIESRIRQLTRQAAPGAIEDEPALSERIARLDGRPAIVFGASRGRFVAVTVVNGRCRRWDPTIDQAALRDLTDGVEFAIHRLNRRATTAASRAAARSTLAELGEEIDRVLLPDSLRRSAAPVVISPFEGLFGVPWSVLPTLHGRAVTVAPSLGSWAAATGRRSARPARPMLAVAGPALDHAAAEAIAVAQVHLDGRALTGAEATTERCVAALESVDVAHFACHGTFRGDNALFSALRLADGDLNVYDLQRCARLPQVVVLSACGAGQSTVLLGGALLGMASALMQLGVSSVIAPLTPISDEASVGLMVSLHRALAAGQNPAVALASARGPDLDAAAASFICFGS